VGGGKIQATTEAEVGMTKGPLPGAFHRDKLREREGIQETHAMRAANAAKRVATMALKLGKFRLAESASVKAERIASRIRPDRTQLLVAALREGRADIYDAQGRLGDAAIVCASAAELAEKALTSAHPTARKVRKKAETYKMQSSLIPLSSALTQRRYLAMFRPDILNQ